MDSLSGVLHCSSLPLGHVNVTHIWVVIVVEVEVSEEGHLLSSGKQ